jgi:hypothetical protein
VSGFCPPQGDEDLNDAQMAQGSMTSPGQQSDHHIEDASFCDAELLPYPAL